MKSFMLVLLFDLTKLISAKLPTIEKELVFKTTLTNYSMGYSSGSFTISKDVIYVANGANVGNSILKFDLNGTYLGEYPGWYNFPHDIIVGGDNQDQVLVSALGAMDDTGLLRFGLVLYTSEGEYLHGLHEKDSGLERPWGLGNFQEDKVVVADWIGNKTYIVDFDWKNGTVQSKTEIADVAYPTKFAFTEKHIVITSLVCCQLDEFVKISIFDFHGNYISEMSHLPSGQKFLNPEDVAIDPFGNILLSDMALGTIVLSSDLTEEIGRLEFEGGFPHKMMFYKEKLYILMDLQTSEDQFDSFIYVYKYSA